MTFEDYIAACRRVHERGEAFSQDNRLYWTIEGGFYVATSNPWVDGFGDDLRVNFFEQMAALPEEVTRDVSAWLGLDPAAAADVNYSVENRTIQYRSKLLQRVALAANKEGALGGRRRLKEPLRRIYYRLNRKPEAETMSEDTRAELQALFAPGNAALAERLRALGYDRLPDWLA